MEVLIVLLLIVLNGVFSMSELAVMSAQKARLQQAAEKGSKRARTALELNENPTRFLSTVQLGITLIGILSGAYGEKALSGKAADLLGRVAVLAPYKETLALVIVVSLLTYFSLVIGELIPKRLAITSPERIAFAVAAPMRGLSLLFKPAVTLLTVSTEGLLKIVGLGHVRSGAVTEEDVEMLIKQGTEEGIFDQSEQDMMKRVIQLGDRPITDLMTHRLDVAWLDIDSAPEENARRIAQAPRSRYPVCKGSLDHIIGVVQTRDIAADVLSGKPLDLTGKMQNPLLALERLSMLEVLRQFKESRVHIAIVVDEFGSVQGLVTLNNVLEAIVGNLPGHDEVEDPRVVQRDDGSWLLDALLPIDEFQEMFKIASLPDGEQGEYRTLSGFVLARMGRIPGIGEHFEWNGLRFEVVDVDKHRLDKILVSLVAPSASGTPTDPAPLH